MTCGLEGSFSGEGRVRRVASGPDRRRVPGQAQVEGSFVLHFRLYLLELHRRLGQRLLHRLGVMEGFCWKRRVATRDDGGCLGGTASAEQSVAATTTMPRRHAWSTASDNRSILASWVEPVP